MKNILSKHAAIIHKITQATACLIIALVCATANAAAQTAPPAPAPAPTPAPTSDDAITAQSLYGNWNEYVPGDKPIGGACDNSGTADLIGADNIQKAYNYLVGKGLSPAQAAGIIGNLMVEDPGLVPDRVQGGGTAPAPIGGKGYGIAQWTSAGRQAGLVNLATSQGKPASDLGLQLDFLWQELSGPYAAVLTELKQQTTAQAASDVILVKFEAPADHVPGGPNSIKRGQNAEAVMLRYGLGSVVGGPTSSATCSAAVNCTPADAAAGTVPGAPAGLSPVRQAAVCLAQAELAAWKQPGVQPQELCKKYGADKGAAAPWCEEWCADFTSWIYDQAKYPLQPDPNWRVPAVAGIKAIGLRNQNFHWHAAAGYAPKPGDLAIHDLSGSHVNMVVGVAGNVITMIGGDQGPGPYGGAGSKSIVSQVTTTTDVSGYVTPD